MDAALATQLVTVGATLGGVVLTLAANALLERRRARDAHRLEALRLSAEHAKWLRAERTAAYAAYSLAAEEAQQFLRTELPSVLSDAARHAVAAARWRELRTELRKAYNQVSLVGAEEPRAAGTRVWRTARNSGNDLIADLTARDVDLPDRVRAAANELGAEINAFLESCRTDLQSN